MTKSSFKSATRVLIFNGAGNFVGEFFSLQEAAKYQYSSVQAVSFACSGTYISSGAYYFRQANSNINIEEADWGKLKLVEYDKLCGEKRNYHSPKTMAQKYKALVRRIKIAKRGRNDEE